MYLTVFLLDGSPRSLLTVSLAGLASASTMARAALGSAAHRSGLVSPAWRRWGSPCFLKRRPYKRPGILGGAMHPFPHHYSVAVSVRPGQAARLHAAELTEIES